MTVRLLVNVDVDDLDRGIAFYRDGLGLGVRRTLFGGTVAEMTGAPCPVYLLAKPAGSPAAPTLAARRDYAGHWTPVHLDLAVDDLEPAVARARRAGATLDGAVTTHAWGRLAVMRDPFGHGFCLIELGPTGYDAVADRADAPR